jgi:hypothetical protein
MWVILRSQSIKSYVHAHTGFVEDGRNSKYGQAVPFVAKEFNKRRYLNTNFNKLLSFNLHASSLGLQYGRYILLHPISIVVKTVYCAFLSI